MVNKKFNKIILKARKESEKLSKEFGNRVWVEIQINFNKKFKPEKVFHINPYCVDLKKYTYGLEREFITGEYISVPDLRESDLYKRTMR